ncbi:hypothetical protein NDU88_006776 [Pleurodeles waltl]|uniref:Uncharacterized protein n=1 Tax=Pleurodeles waltl TaxID=8319 RepID=A0AAV7TZH5_PLEWA|nr:hypothetical protein NDU88_006776 [Pleurodeles waltl]
MERRLLSANEGLGGPYRDDLPSANPVNPILKATRAAWRRCADRVEYSGALCDPHMPDVACRESWTAAPIGSSNHMFCSSS